MKECSGNNKILIESDKDLIYFKDLIPELDDRLFFPTVTDFKYQDDQNICFLARKKTLQNVKETNFYKLDI